MSWHDVIAMPIRSFWSLVKHSHKIRAEEGMLGLHISMASQSTELAKSLQERFSAETEDRLPPTRFDPNVDHAAGIERLRMLQAGG